MSTAQKTKKSIDFRCRLFASLQLTCQNLQSAGVETLNRLDIDTFLYATALCTEALQESHQASGYLVRDRPVPLLADISDQLCTVAQGEWWTAAHRVYVADYQTELGTLRQTLQHGIEVIRAIGNHGLDARLMVRLANMLTDRAATLSSRAELSAEQTAIEARAALYWTAAVPLLERMQFKQVIQAPDKRIFSYEGKNLSSNELESLVQDGRLFLAIQRMRHKEYEQALMEFNALKSPHASFYASQIYAELANDELRSQPREAITSEMRSKHIILLTKARDSIYLTLDRLNNPAVDKKHPLNTMVDKLVEEIESKLNRIDPDVYRNDGVRDGSECDTVSDVQSAGDHNSLLGNGSLYPLLLTPRHQGKSSTPYRSPLKTNDHPDADYRRTETRPSPERLDSQIRLLSQMVHSRDSVIQSISDQNKALLDSNMALLDTNKNIMAELQGIKDSMAQFSEVKKQLQDLQKETLKLRRAQVSLAQSHHLVGDLSLPGGETEEELYVFDEEDYAEEVNLAAAQLGQYPTFPPYPNYSNLHQITGLLGTSTVTYGQPPDAAPALQLPPNMNSFFRNVDPALIYPPALAGYYGHGALPFSEGQQLPDFRAPHVHPSQVLAHGMPLPEQKLVVTTAPVNVVITSSDVLPTSVPTHQPTLSVTIPPQHRLGTVHPPPLPTEIPHAFQISMPPQGPLHMASQLEKQSAALSPVLPISTNSLLVSVPSPLYSAVTLEKTPPKGFGGVGSANNSFGGSPSKNTSRGDQRLSTSSAVDDEDHDAYPDFQPVIPMPAEVAANTGEEGEEVMFEGRGKLYRFVEKEWKERGVGTIKFLHNKSTGKVRLLMRREQVLKICANHLITPDMELTAMNNRAWIWVANDFADEQVRLEKLCIRFKTVEEALNFKDAFRDACQISKISLTPVKSALENQPKVPVLSDTEKSKSVLSPKTEGISKSPIAPPKLVNVFGTGSGTPPVVSSTSTSAVPNSSPPKITVGGFTFASPPTFKADHSDSISKIIEEVSRSPDKIAEVPKVSPFAGFSFTSSTPQHTKKVDSSQKQVHFGTPVIEPAKLPEKTTAVKNIFPKNDGSGLMFSASQTDLSFTDLAVDNSSFNIDSSFKGFAGAGQSVFGTSPTVKKQDTGETETSEDFVPTAEFTPVIPLPELISIKTGEEEEEILFEERAKLLRFDLDTKQWKERGIGKFKLLLDPKTGKVRLLQRREQVLKVCCNHMLTSSMEFNPLKTSDKAYSWYAQDYSEGEVKPELFALRFKTSEQAVHFKKVVDTTQANMIDDKLPVAGLSDGTLCQACLTPNAGDLSHSKSCKKSKTPVNVEDRSTLHGDAKTPGKTPSSQLFKPKAGSWECKSCYTRNEEHHKQCLACETPNPNSKPHASAVQKPLSELFKPKSGSWECKSCYTRNEENHKQCLACETPNPNSKPQASAVQKPLSELFKPKSGSWECNECYTRNDGAAFSCVACQTAKPGHEVVSTKSEPSTTFQFGIPPTSKPSLIPLSEVFKPKIGSWECNGCYTRNDGDKQNCPACNSPKPSAGEETVHNTSASGSTLTFKASQATGSFNLGTAPPSTGFTFGIQPSAEPAKFSFGVPTTTAVTSSITTPVKAKTAATKSDFSFVTPTTPTSLLGSLPTKPFKFESNSSTGAFLFGSTAETPPSRKETEPNNTSFVFGTKSQTAEIKPETTSFSFGTSLPIAIPNACTTPPPDTSGPNFTFGSPGKFEFHFQAKSPGGKSPKSPAHPTLSGEDSDNEEETDEGDHIYFQPVIPLPDKVPVCTGEEDEDVLYCHRAKLYRYAAAEWKERGIGDVKLLQHKTTHKIRMLMRRDQIHKLCLNHYLSPELIFVAKDDKTWLWSAADFSEGTLQNEQFAMRFKSPEIAMEFKSALDKAMVDLSTGSHGDISSVENHVSAYTTDQSSMPDDVQFVEEILQVTPEEKEAALRLQLPANFYSYRYKPNCPGCIGCEPDNTTPNHHQKTRQADVKPESFASPAPTLCELLKLTPTVPTSANLKRQTPSLFATQKSATPLFGQQAQLTSFQSATPIFGQSTYQMPTAHPVFGMKKPDETKPSASTLFAGLGTDQKSTPTSTPSSDGLTALENKFKAPGMTSSFLTPTEKGFGFESPRSSTDVNGVSGLASSFGLKQPDPESSQSETVPFLPVDSKLSFATIASCTADQPTFTKDNSKNFTWSGAGTTLFSGGVSNTSKGSPGPKGSPGVKGSPKSAPGTPAADEEEAGGEDDTHDPHFEPIIALPDAIEVRTGEEDEIKLFNHRALLYRYQSATKEWKERGVGEIKILKHPVNNTFRLLLRREQIHKVVLNQLVTSDLQLKPMATSDRAWCWAAYNHAEEPASLEELAIKFKFPEVAKDFYDALQQCIQEINTHAASAHLSAVDAKATESEVEEDGEDGEDEYEDYEDEINEIMFEKRATLQVQKSPQGPWQNVGMGELQVASVYQEDHNFLIVNFLKDGTPANSKPELLSSIDHETILDLNKKACSWSFMDYDDESPCTKKTFTAKFASETAALEFFHILSDGTNVPVPDEDD